MMLFNKVDYTLGGLIELIASGQLGLPDIQRPFVWRNVKIRNLFDSMYRGYPVGFLLFWETGVEAGSRQVGAEKKQLAPTRMIVDGQQRLTSLYAVVRNVPVVRENFSTEHIEIAFNPLQGRFEVADAAIKRDKTFIPNISTLWDAKIGLIKFAGDYVEGLRSARGGDLAPEEIAKAQAAIERLHGLVHFPFTALELSSKASPDQVSEVFVRINSEGKQLNQSDFILTLMSVFWDDGRTQLEDFSRRARTPGGPNPSPYNALFQPAPDQLLRVAVAVGFRRARLSSVYSILRGRNADGVESPETRDRNFEILKAGQKATLNVQYWHDFLKAVSLAGYRTNRIISSGNSLVFSHALYLLGRTAFKVEEHELRRAIAQWLFMSNLTGRYTNSPESQMEFDLASLRVVTTGQQFLSALATICTERLTGDFWNVTLPGDLATSAARSPSMFAYYAALSVLDARALYSNHTVRELLDPALQPVRSALERHHLFPVNWLKKNGIDDQRDYNQIANFTMIEWGDNVGIQDSPPSVYVPDLEKRFDTSTLGRMYRHHALPHGWQAMDYQAFLRTRRQLMSQTIRDAYEALAGAGKAETVAPSINEMVLDGESAALEFKSTLRTNLHTGERDPKMEFAILRTIAGFLNTRGGTLMVGVADDQSLVGIERDGFPNEDKMALHLISLLKERMGGQQALYVHPRFDDYEGGRVLVVSCEAARSPVFVKDAAVERFFVRYGPSTQELSGAQAQEFIRQRFAGVAANASA